MGNTFADGVEFARVDTEEHQNAQDDVWNDEEKVSNAEEAKQVVENTFHGALAHHNETQNVPN